MKPYAIIAAGGSGVRMGNTTPKQFLELNGMPVLWHSVKAFAEALPGIHIVVVVPALHLERARAVCGEFRNVVYTEGGASRYLSVKNGLQHVAGDSIVLVHDAVRCLVTKELIVQCYEQAKIKGSAIPSVAVNDSIRILSGESHKVIDRNQVRIIQTPQTFRSEILLKAFAVEDREEFTDEATVVEFSGTPVHLIGGDHTNIKITRPLDLLIAEKILQDRLSFQQAKQ